MAQETYQQCWNKLLLRCPELSPKLAQDFIVNAFRRLVEHRRWSWRVKFNQFIAPDAYSTGTVSVTNGFTTVTGSGTAWTAAMVGQQFRVGLAAPIYTIAQFDSPTQIELDQVWGGPTSAASGYSIYQCYFTPPSDFHQFITLWDPAFNWQLDRPDGGCQLDIASRWIGTGSGIWRTVSRSEQRIVHDSNNNGRRFWHGSI